MSELRYRIITLDLAVARNQAEFLIEGYQVYIADAQFPWLTIDVAFERADNDYIELRAFANEPQGWVWGIKFKKFYITHGAQTGIIKLLIAPNYGFPIAAPYYPAKQAYLMQNWIIDIATSGDHTIITAAAGQRFRVNNLTFVCAAAVDVVLKSGSTALTGAMSFAANSGFVSNYGDNPIIGGILGGDNFIVNLSANVQVSGHVIGYIY